MYICLITLDRYICVISESCGALRSPLAAIKSECRVLAPFQERRTPAQHRTKYTLFLTLPLSLNVLPTVLLDLDVKGYCSIIGCVLKSEFYAALTGSHIMIPRIRTATGLKLILELPVVTVRLDTGLTQAGHELKGQ